MANLTPEKHLAAILAAYSDTDGYLISNAMSVALRAAEADFDGVEADDVDVSNFDEGIWKRGEPPVVNIDEIDIDFNHARILREVTPMDEKV